MHGLIPVEGQHQHRCCSSDHILLRAHGMFPRKHFLLNQVDTSRFMVNYGSMYGRGRWYHVWVRDMTCRKTASKWSISLQIIFSQGVVWSFRLCWPQRSLWCILVCVLMWIQVWICTHTHTHELWSETVQLGPLRISYLQCNNPLNIS